MYATLETAIRIAKKQAAAQDTEFFVVYEAGEFDAVNAWDLDTWYQGISASEILHCIGPDGCFS